MESEFVKELMPVYQKFRCESDCFETGGNPENFLNAGFIVCGNDPAGSKTAKQFASTFVLPPPTVIKMDLSMPPQVKTDLQNFVNQFKKCQFNENGILVAHNEYYQALMKNIPAAYEKVSGAVPGCFADPIHELVMHTTNLEAWQFADKFKYIMAKECPQNKYFFVSRQLKRYDKLIVFPRSVESAVYLAFIFQELRLSYHFSPQIILLYDGRNYNTVTDYRQLCIDLHIPAEQIMCSFSSLENAGSLLRGKCLFVVPHQLSLFVKQLAGEFSVSNPDFIYGTYVFPEELESLLNGKESSPRKLLKNLQNALYFYHEDDRGEIIALIARCTDYYNRQEDSVSDMVSRRRRFASKMAELVARHRDYIRDLYEL